MMMVVVVVVVQNTRMAAKPPCHPRCFSPTHGLADIASAFYLTCQIVSEPHLCDVHGVYASVQIRTNGTSGTLNGTADESPRQPESEKQMTAVQTRRLDQKEQAFKSTIAPIRQIPAKPAEPTTAEGWKDRGNALFRKGDWTAAKRSYTK